MKELNEKRIKVMNDLEPMMNDLKEFMKDKEQLNRVYNRIDNEATKNVILDSMMNVDKNKDDLIHKIDDYIDNIAISDDELMEILSDRIQDYYKEMLDGGSGYTLGFTLAVMIKLQRILQTVMSIAKAEEEKAQKLVNTEGNLDMYPEGNLDYNESETELIPAEQPMTDEQLEKITEDKIVMKVEPADIFERVAEQGKKIQEMESSKKTESKDEED